MRPRHTAILFVALLLWALGALAAPVPVIAAANTCDQVVIDDAAVFKDQLPRVTAEAQSLIALGTDVRVRAIASLNGAATLDSYEQVVERACPSWQATDGSRKNNLIVMMMSLQERKTGLYYGSQWERTLGPNWTRIQADLMNPHIRDGDYAGGFVAGLQETGRLVDLQLHPQNAPSGAQPQPMGAPMGAPAAAPDLSGLSRALVFGLILVALLATGVLLYRGGLASRAHQSKRRLAQQNALTAKRSVASRVEAYAAEFREAKLRLDILATQVAEQEAQPLRDRLAEAQRLADAATREYGTAQDGVINPEQSGLSTEEYDNIRAAYQQILATTEQADTLKSTVVTQATDLEQAMTDAPKRLDAARSALDPARSKLQAVAQLGFKTEQNELLLDRARRLLDQAAAALGEKRFGESTRLSIAASKLTDQAVSTAERYAPLREELAADLGRLAERSATVSKATGTAAALLTALQSTYAPTSWESVRDSTTTMAASLRSVEKLATEAKGLGSMEQQQWDKARAALTQANGGLDAVESVLRTINSLKATLDQARQDAPDELAAAQTAVERAAEAVQQLPSDRRADYSAELDGGKRSLAATAEEAGVPKPDFVVVIKRAKDAHALADAIFERARAERDARDRDEANRRAIRNSVLTSMLINMALSGGRNRGNRPGGPTGWGGGGGGGSTGWGSPRGGGGSSSW